MSYCALDMDKRLILLEFLKVSIALVEQTTLTTYWSGTAARGICVTR